MSKSCAACGTPLSSTDDRCPQCGGQAAKPSDPHISARLPDNPIPTRVRGRLATGAVTGFSAVRQVPVVGRTTLLLSWSGMVLTVGALVLSAAAGGVVPFVGAVALTGVCLVPAAGLGLALDRTLPADERSGKWWSLIKPLRAAGRVKALNEQVMTVKEVSGAVHECTVRGALKPAPPSRGDVVEVYGKRRAGGVLVDRLIATDTGEVIKVVGDRRLMKATATAIAALWTATPVALGTLLALG